MLDISGVKIDYEKVALRLGYSKLKTRLDEKTERSLKENISMAQKLIAPKAAVSFDDITVNDAAVFFFDGYKIESNYVAKLFQGCKKAYCIAVTIGAALERKIKSSEIFEAVILDAAGSVAVEEAVGFINQRLSEREAKDGRALTRRFSPGYGDWPLECQKSFLERLKADKIGLSVNESFIMVPEKSVSAVIGVKTATRSL